MLCSNSSMFGNWWSILVSNLSVPDEGYSRNLSCTLNFLYLRFCFFFYLQVSEFKEKYQNIYFFHTIGANTNTFFYFNSLIEEQVFVLLLAYG